MKAYGISDDSVDEYRNMSKISALESMKQFSRGLVRLFAEKYLRIPIADDMVQILGINAARGFPGMFGSIYCQHCEWKVCLTRLAGQYKGKEKEPTMVLEGIANGELWIWFVFYGIPGSLNDLNILHKSTKKGKILGGDFPLRMEYNIIGAVHLFTIFTGR